MMEYYYGLETDADIYFTIPKLLFSHEVYKSMHCEAKVLYGLCLDRMRLSQRNGWFDDKNRVYIIYPIDRICDDLGCSNKTAVKWLAELETYGLIEKHRLGRGKTSLLYVKKCSGVLTEKDRIKHCRKEKSPVQESEPSPAVYRKPANEAVKPTVRKQPERETVREAFKAQISYDELQTQSDGKLADKIVEVAVNMLMLPENYEITLQGMKHTYSDVQEKLKELKKEHILYVIDSFKNSEKPVKNLMKYLQTSLYNAANTYDFYAATKENASPFEDYIEKDQNKTIGNLRFTESQIYDETPIYYFVELDNGNVFAVPKADVEPVQDGIYTFVLRNKPYPVYTINDFVQYDMQGIHPDNDFITCEGIKNHLESPEDVALKLQKEALENQKIQQMLNNLRSKKQESQPSAQPEAAEQDVSKALDNQAVREILERATGKSMNDALMPKAD